MPTERQEGQATRIAGKALAHRITTPSPARSTEKGVAGAVALSVSWLFMESPSA